MVSPGPARASDFRYGGVSPACASRRQGGTSAQFTSAAAVLAALLSAGCAETHWEKAGADAASLDADLEACARVAALEARREEVPRLSSALVIRADPHGRPVVVPNYTRESDRYLRERDLMGVCMRRKGYVQVPDKR